MEATKALVAPHGGCPLAAIHRAAVGIRPTRYRHELPVVGTIFKRQLKNAVRAVVASHAVGSRVSKAVEALAASADHKGLWAIRVGPAGGVLRCEALINMIGTLQNTTDVLGHTETNSRPDTGVR